MFRHEITVAYSQFKVASQRTLLNRLTALSGNRYDEDGYFALLKAIYRQRPNLLFLWKAFEIVHASGRNYAVNQMMAVLQREKESTRHATEFAFQQIQRYLK